MSSNDHCMYSSTSTVYCITNDDTKKASRIQKQGRRKESGGALRLTRQVSDEKEKISKKALCIFNNKHRGEKVIETSGFDWLVVGTVNK